MEGQLTLRPSDVAVAARLAQTPGARYQDLARGLQLGLAEVHRGVRRLERAGLLRPRERRVRRQALLEFLVHGVRYAFPPMLVPRRAESGSLRRPQHPLLQGSCPVDPPSFGRALRVGPEARVLHRCTRQPLALHS